MNNIDHERIIYYLEAYRLTNEDVLTSEELDELDRLIMIVDRLEYERAVHERQMTTLEKSIRQQLKKSIELELTAIDELSNMDHSQAIQRRVDRIRQLLK